MRLLLWAVIIFAIAMLLLHLKKIAIQGRNRDPVHPAKADGLSEAMIQCAHCGIHIPESEAVVIEPDVAFCCKEHRLKHFSR